MTALQLHYLPTAVPIPAWHLSLVIFQSAQEISLESARTPHAAVERKASKQKVINFFYLIGDVMINVNFCICLLVTFLVSPSAPAQATDQMGSYKPLAITKPNAGQVLPSAGECYVDGNKNCDINIVIPKGSAIIGNADFYAKEGPIWTPNPWDHCTNPDRTCPSIGRIGFTPAVTYVHPDGSISINTTVINWSADRTRTGRMEIHFQIQR